MTETHPSALSAKLLEGLSRFRAPGVSGCLPHGENLFTYCSLSKERLIAICLTKPIVGVVLSGTKEVWRGMVSGVLRPGTMFILPAKVEMDILNLPDEAIGSYQSMILEISHCPHLIGEPHRPAPRWTDEQPFEVRLTPHIVNAAIHAASALADGPARSQVRQSRLTELLALLQGDPAAAPLFDISVAERVRRLVGADLSRDWKAPVVAAALGLSESTLRRRLALEGLPFAKLLRGERMAAARRLLGDREPSQSAAALVGYSSRTHFAKRFKSEFGASPRGVRQRAITAGGQAMRSGKAFPGAFR